MKIEELRTKSDDQLKAQLLDAKRECMNLRFQRASATLEKPSSIREVKKDIARIMTVQNERALGQAEKPAKKKAAPKKAAPKTAKTTGTKAPAQAKTEAKDASADKKTD